ncbi:MAG: mechanosensitive ion channel family protein [Eggerthellaceae bacterium]|nr:mechanosensitive ion channel family protein [Eggerthellaceae bacterium]
MEEFLQFLISPGMIASYIIVGVGTGILLVLNHFSKKIVERIRANEGIGSPHDTAVRTAFSITKTVVVIVVILAVVQANNIDVTSLMVSLGVGGVIAGLALQDFFKDVIMGFHIFADRFFQVGDVIVYNGKNYEVIDLTLRTTKLRSLFDDSIASLNNRLIESVVVVGSIVVMDIPLPYETAPKDIDEIMAATCKKINTIKNVSACHYLGLQEFGESAVYYRLTFKCKPQLQGPAKRNALRMIFDDLNEKGITIPYNQLDIHTI